MYEEYFGFAEKPFSLTPDPRYLHESECHRSAVQVLEYAIRRREGLMLVSGDTGTGKTTLCRALLDRVDRDTFASLVLNPFLSQADLLRRLLQDFGVVSPQDLRTGRLAEVRVEQLLDTLRTFLLSLVPLGARAVVVIDEAQHLSPAALEQVWMLSNLETDREKLIQIVLVGDLGLPDRLRHPKLRHLDQRVAIRHRLDRLTRDELVGYLSHRLSTAGAATVVRFTPRSLDAVHRIADGVPRLVNQLCDRTLLAAYASRTTRVTPELVLQAAESLELRDPAASRLRAHLPRLAVVGRLAAAAAALVAVVGGGLVYRSAVPATGRWEGVASDRVAMSGWSPDSILPPVTAPPVAAARTPTPSVRPLTAPSSRQAAGPRPYSILIGSFADADGDLAIRTQDLQGLGFQVYEIELDLGSAGRRRQLLVGGYADVERAVADEARLRLDARFSEARIIVSTTSAIGAP